MAQVAGSSYGPGSSQRSVSDARKARRLAVFLGAFVVVWTLRATLLYAVDEQLGDRWRALYGVLVKTLIWGAFAWAGSVRWRDGAPPASLGLRILPGPRAWGWCLGVTGLFLGGVLGVSVGLMHRAPVLSALAGAATLSSLLSPLIEEVLFRGCVLRELRELLPGWAANGVASALFAGIHLPFWLTHGTPLAVVAVNTVGVFLFSPAIKGTDPLSSPARQTAKTTGNRTIPGEDAGCAIRAGACYTEQP